MEGVESLTMAMKQVAMAVVLVCCAAGAWAAGAPATRPSVLLFQARAIFGQLPGRMPGGENDTPEKVQLGKALYFEKGLSANSTQSCNDCHRIDDNRGGAEPTPTSTGALGHVGGRNAPTVLNAGFQVAQFWDGRAADLAEQAKGPPLNPIEMCMPSPKVIEERLRSLGYSARFDSAFGRDNSLSFDNAAAAIAAFERTLISRSRFDDFLAGEEQALSSAEKQGLAAFMNEGCIRCHSGPLLGGVLYQKAGVYHDYAKTSDPGRFAVTKDPADRMVFKVPMLRNIALTSPYFHDGKVGTLPQAIDEMAWLQLDRRLDRPRIDAIMRFLLTLSDKARTAAPMAARPAMPDFGPPDLAAIVRQDELVVYGHALLTDTYRLLGPGAADKSMAYSGSAQNCANCHQDTGTKPYGMSWVGVAHRYPAYRGRSGKMGALEDRINGCMQRSMNGRPLPKDGREMKAMVAFFGFMSEGMPKTSPGVGIPAVELPPRAADPKAGRELFSSVCQSCHGADGKGYALADGTRIVPPVWGDGSYNIGAGMARVLTAAGFIRNNMPLGTPADRPHLTDEQAIDVAAYINSQPRPGMANLEKDYPNKAEKPVDCPYPPYADEFPPEQHRHGPFAPLVEWRKKALARPAEE